MPSFADYMDPRVGISRAFQSQTYIQDRIDVQDTGIYDTITITAGNPLTAGTQFFSSVGQGSGKNLAQTNMTQSQRLPSPQAFSIHAFRLRWSENILQADALALLNGFALEFYLGDKWYQRNPIWHYAGGGGLTGFSVQNNAYAYSNGMNTREAIKALRIPIVIENGMNFYGQLVGTSSITLTAGGSGGTGLILTLFLDGLYARGVQ